MPKNVKHEAAIPNPALKNLGVLIGDWETVGKHRLMPGITLHGRASFTWLEGGAYLMMRSEVDEPKVPSAIAIFGSDDADDTYSMLYFDERGVSRKFEASLYDNIWKYWRNVHGFSQRFTGTITDDGNTIIGVAELNEDDVTWMRDLEMTYTRVK